MASSSSTKIKMKGLKNFLIVFGICFVINMLSRGIGTEWKDLYFVFVGTMTSVMIWYGCAYIAEAYNEKVSWTEHPYQRLILSFLATAALVLVVYFITICMMRAPSPNFRIQKVFSYFRWSEFLFTYFITLMISFFLYGRGFFMDWKSKMEEADKYKEEKHLYQYEMLRNQVNPHFLFNNLSVLSNLVHKDADLAEDFINKFANVYRYVLDSRMKELVPIDEELKHLEDYLFLMKIRFGEGFKINIEISQPSGKIVPMTLQMLVENIFKHNNLSISEPLSISILQQGEYIVVSNNILRRQHVEKSGVGLENIKERYKHLGSKEMNINQTEDVFSVEIPILI